MSSVTPSQRTTCGVVALATGLLGFGWLGIHKFIMGKTNPGIITIVASLLTCGIYGTVVSIIEGVVYLTKSDEDWYHTYIVGGKDWF